MRAGRKHTHAYRYYMTTHSKPRCTTSVPKQSRCGFLRVARMCGARRVTRIDVLTLDPGYRAFVASGASPIAFKFPSLGLRTSIGSNAPRAGNNSQPQQGYRFEPQHERVSDTVHIFSVRFERTCAWGEQYWISVAHQMLLPAYVGAVSLPLGHSAWLTPWVAR
jgi:hypothetical protein